jgi:hypothetical protein
MRPTYTPETSWPITEDLRAWWRRCGLTIPSLDAPERYPWWTREPCVAWLGATSPSTGGPGVVFTFRRLPQRPQNVTPSERGGLLLCGFSCGLPSPSVAQSP